MKPKWLDSIRAILALILCLSYCGAVLWCKIPLADLSGLKEMAILALTFYYVLKERPKIQ